MRLHTTSICGIDCGLGVQWMAREYNKLSPVAVKNASRPGLYGDGAGLWLNVGPTGGKSWLLRYMLNGKAREMGLGPLHTIGLSEARERARAAPQILLDGVDPLAVKEADRRGIGTGTSSASSCPGRISAGRRSRSSPTNTPA